MSLDRRQEILSAAAELFAHQGYHPTTVADIAKTAQVAQGTVYLYFESKKAIFSALVEVTLSLFRELQVYSENMMTVETADQIVGAMPHIYAQALEIFSQNRTLVRLMLTEVRGADPEVEEKLAGFYDHIVAQTACGIRLGIDKQLFRDDVDAELAAQCIIGIMERFAALILAEEKPDIQLMANQIAAFELGGLMRPDHILMAAEMAAEQQREKQTGS